MNIELARILKLQALNENPKHTVNFDSSTILDRSNYERKV